jgi:hypothetical protein
MENEQLVELYQQKHYDQILSHYDLQLSQTQHNFSPGIIELFRGESNYSQIVRISHYALVYQNMALLYAIFSSENQFAFHVLHIIFLYDLDNDFLLVVPGYPLLVSKIIHILENGGSSDHNNLSSTICNKNKINFVTYFLEIGVDPKGSFIKNLFNYAIHQNNLLIVQHLLDCGCDFPQLFDINSWRSYPSKCYPIKFSTIKLLDAYQIDFSNYINEFFLSAVNESDLEFITYCLDCGADPNYQNSRALCLCGKYSDLTIQKYLFERGANAKLVGFDAIKSLFWNSITVHYAEIRFVEKESDLLNLIKLLVMNQFDLPTYLDKLMILSSAYNYREIFGYCLELGANPHAFGGMAFVQAVYNCHLEMVLLLLELGTDLSLHPDILNILAEEPNIIDDIEQSYTDPMLTECYVRSHNNFEKVFWILIDHGATIKDPHLLQWVAYTHSDTTEELLTYILEKIDVNTKFKEWTFDNDGIDDETILGVMIGRDKKNHHIKYILANGADFTMHNHRSLQIAVGRNNKEIVEVLLELGSIYHPIPGIKTNLEIINLLELYGQYNHQLRKIEKITCLL